MTRTLTEDRNDLVLAINEANESGDNAHIGGLLWVAGEIGRLVRAEELWNRNEAVEEANHETLC